MTCSRRFPWLICIALCGLARSAIAQEASAELGLNSEEPRDEATSAQDESPLEERADIGLVLGGKVGAGFGVSGLGATPVFELELGYAPDLGASLGHSIEIFLIGQYAQPGTDGSGAEPDPRLPGAGGFSYEVTEQMLSLSLGGLYRFDVSSDLLMPYGGLGGRMYMLRTKSKGEADGQALGESEETKTAVGLVILGGVDVFVGPGALLAELSFGWAPVDAYILRDTDLGALSLSVGYRVIL